MGIQNNKTSSPAAPLLKNSAAAPFVYFDNAPLYGIAGMGIEVELTAAAIMPKSDGTVTRETVCVGHLRCGPDAAIALVDSLQKAIVMYQRGMAERAAKAAETAPSHDKAA